MVAEVAELGLMRPRILTVPTSYCPLYVHHLTYLLNSQMKPVQQSPPFVTEDAESHGFRARALSLQACTADRQPPDCARAQGTHAPAAAGLAGFPPGAAGSH